MMLPNALLLARLTCLVSVGVCACVQSPASAAQKSDAAFQKLWTDTKVTLSTRTDSKPVKPDDKPAVDQKADDEPIKPRLRKNKRVGSGHQPDASGAKPGLLEGPDQRQSEREVCRSQCSLERMGCDQGNNSFQNRSDQLQAAQSSCFLAVRSCLSRC